jgi:hypothetical protein
LHTCHEYLANLIPAREIHDSSRHILTSKDLRFDPKISRKTKMFLHGLAFRGREISKVWGPVHEQGQAVGVKKVGHPAPAANEHGGGGVSCYVD